MVEGLYLINNANITEFGVDSEIIGAAEFNYRINYAGFNVIVLYVGMDGVIFLPSEVFFTLLMYRRNL